MARIPISTYRLQFNRAFRFKEAAEITGYLSDLGISDVYCSPYLAAVPGSTHGYDIVDPDRLNPELGSDDEYGHFVQTLKQHGMGQIMDVVANHMGINSEVNRWWQDVLENGPCSPFASYFDIDWNPLKPELQDKVLLPILGAPYGRVLEAKELQLLYEEGRIALDYYGHRFPVAPETCVLLLATGLETFLEQEGRDAPHVVELQSILTALKHLPSRHSAQPDAVAERYREKEVIRRRLAALVEGHAAVRTYVAASLEQANGKAGVPSSFDLLHRLLDAQAYRLAHWRVAAEEVNYRRFFDINELAALRMEQPAVFERSHRLIFDLLKSGAVTGLRIDHVDGLYDPADYLQRLQDWAATELTPGTGPLPLYLIVEKILGPNEDIPAPWPVHGTTGYEFLSLINGLFVDRSNERALDMVYARFTGEEQHFDELAYACKRLIMKVSMASELNVLGHQLNRLSERDRGSRDFTLNSLIDVLREIIACFPVYRTYIRPGKDGLLDRDRSFIWQAVAKAKRRNPAVSGLVFDFVRDLLLTPVTAGGEGGDEHRAFVMKFQQLTSPVTAKGVEDTAFYRYHRLLSLNEVGGDPQQFGIPPPLVHQQLKVRQAKNPHALSATATHDTKRGEDLRARLNVLSEIPKDWQQHALRWRKLNRKWKTNGDQGAMPAAADEYALYQTLLGAWPATGLQDPRERDAFRERIHAAMIKALREAKSRTSWVNPDAEYEDAMARFVSGILDPVRAQDFLADFETFQHRVSAYGIYHSLAQVLLKMTAPGIPDFYQGSELWDFSLVDPDNRRPVDFDLRRTILEEFLAQETAGAPPEKRLEELLGRRDDGRIKLWLILQTLRFRRRHEDLFLAGEYVPLQGTGPRRDHLFAFARLHNDAAAVTVIPRLLTVLLPDPSLLPVGEALWAETGITVPSWKPGSAYRNVLTGARLRTISEGDRQILPAAEVFHSCPVALLEREI